MENVVKIQNQEVMVKEYKGQRVVTFKDIDSVHERVEGTARKRFNDNKKHMIEGEDYFVRKTDEAKREYGITAPNGLILITEQGYLMLVKSFTDDLAWNVQRQLVKSYFNPQRPMQTSELSPELQMFSKIFESAARLELKQKEQDRKLEQLDSKVDFIKDVVALRPNAWRKETGVIINKIAFSLGGAEHIKAVREQSYKTLEERMHVALNIRLANKKKTNALNGMCKSKLDKLNQLDVIADDPKLIEGYIAIIKEMAVKYGISVGEVA